MGGESQAALGGQVTSFTLRPLFSGVTALGQAFVFYDRNATLAFSTPHTDLAHLDTAVAWELLMEAPQLDGYCKFWQSNQSATR